MDAPPAQLGETPGNFPKLSAELHLNRDHQIAWQQPREPEFALIGSLGNSAVIQKAGDRDAPHVTDLRRTSKVAIGAYLGNLGRHIGEVKVVTAAPVKDGDDECA